MRATAITGCKSYVIIILRKGATVMFHRNPVSRLRSPSLVITLAILLSPHSLSLSLNMLCDINTGDVTLCCCSRDGLWRKRIFYTVRYPSGTVWWITRAKVSSDGLFQKYSAAGNNRTNFPKTWVRPVDKTHSEGIRQKLTRNDRETMCPPPPPIRF